MVVYALKIGGYAMNIGGYALKIVVSARKIGHKQQFIGHKQPLSVTKNRRPKIDTIFWRPNSVNVTRALRSRVLILCTESDMVEKEW